MSIPTISATPENSSASRWIQFTREKLYDLVWSEPMSTLSATFDISDVGLAKKCRRLDIPYPGRGYWAKKAAGQRVKRTPLPALPAGSSIPYRRIMLLTRST